jgi:[citrate (pro-3S)-lyase] ligase
MYNNIEITGIDLNSSNRIELERFLSSFNLTLDKDVEYSAVATINEKIVGTCSFAGKVLKCFAVSEDVQGEGIASRLITYVTNVLFDKGIFETFIFTKPKNRGIFEGASYKEVYLTEEVVLLEGGMANVRRYVENMFKKSGLENGEKAALVMNCNPFTLGHRYLIERAAGENDEVVVFIVEENRSAFPFNVRIDLVKQGVADLKNVTVIPGGNYIISSATFPSYFLRREDERLSAYTKLDAGIFGRYIASAFNIAKRYVGTEPYCKVTNRYNEALESVLPSFNIEVKKIERLNTFGKAISASEVRSLIKEEKWEEIKLLTSPTTYNYLISEKAKPIIEKIKRSDSPH